MISYAALVANYVGLEISKFHPNDTARRMFALLHASLFFVNLFIVWSRHV